MCGARESDAADADRKYTVSRAISVVSLLLLCRIRAKRGPTSPGPNTYDNHSLSCDNLLQHCYKLQW